MSAKGICLDIDGAVDLFRENERAVVPSNDDREAWHFFSKGFNLKRS